MDHEGVTAAAALELRRQRIRNQAAGSNAAEAAAMVLTEIRGFDLVVLLTAAILDQPDLGRAYVDWPAAQSLAGSFPCHQRAAVELAASLAQSQAIVAVAELTDLSDDDLTVALRAIGHARRSNTPTIMRPPPMRAWPSGAADQVTISQ